MKIVLKVIFLPLARDIASSLSFSDNIAVLVVKYDRKKVIASGCVK